MASQNNPEAMAITMADPAADLEAAQPPDANLPSPEETPYHLVAVMGMTGAGKSTFIQKATGDPNIGIGHHLESETETPQSWILHDSGREVVLIDTPGFDDTFKTDADVLGLVADYLSLTYRRGYRLSGIVYLHDVTKNRMSHGGKANLAMFRALCGRESLGHVVLATTRWGDLSGAARGRAEGFERELSEKREYWAEMRELGSEVVRFDDTRESALAILQRIFDKEGTITLEIQREMVDNQVELKDTKAGEVVGQELLAMRREMEEKIDRIKAEAGRERDQELKKFKERERERTEKVLGQLRAQSRRLNADQSDIMRQYDMKFRQLEKLERGREEEALARAEKEVDELKLKLKREGDGEETAREGDGGETTREGDGEKTAESSRRKKLEEEIQKKELEVETLEKMKKRRRRWALFLSATATTVGAAGLSIINPLAIPVAVGGFVGILNAIFAKHPGKKEGKAQGRLREIGGSNMGPGPS